jgi:hypothetical protein
VKKLILLSVIIAAIAIPARNAKLKDSRKGLRKTLIQTAIFNVIYLILITLVWFRMQG